MSQINNSFGSGGMSLALNEAQFSQFIQHLKDSPVTKPPIRAAVSRIGKQEVHPVWVLGETLQLDANGDIIPDGQRSIVWHESSIAEYMGSVRLREIIPSIHLPLDSSIITRYVCIFMNVYASILVYHAVNQCVASSHVDAYLYRMIDLLEDVMQHNFYASLLVVSGMTLSFHYSTMATGTFGCPIVIAVGPPETGKTKILLIALSIIG